MILNALSNLYLQKSEWNLHLGKFRSVCISPSNTSWAIVLLSSIWAKPGFGLLPDVSISSTKSYSAPASDQEVLGNWHYWFSERMVNHLEEPVPLRRCNASPILSNTTHSNVGMPTEHTQHLMARKTYFHFFTLGKDFVSCSPPAILLAQDQGE